MKRPTQSRLKLSRLAALAAVAALAVAAIWVASKDRGEKQPAPPESQGDRLPSRGYQPVSVPLSAIAEARDRLAHQPAAARRHLDELRRALRQSAPPVASSEIREVLASNTDSATGLEFKAGPGGWLTNAPTLRVFLLDQLGQIDPAAAATQARTILDDMGSPDEWAVALRNLARGDSSADGRALLTSKLESMLAYEPWLRNPSTGFLEAFDVAVHLGGTNLIPALTTVVRMKENDAASHAAYLALDRLTIANAASTLAHLQANPDLMVGREITRANYFARADVRDALQKQIVESYLLNPVLDPVELEKFAGLYPNASFMISHNLLTRNDTPDHAWLAARDTESLRLVRQWIADPRFAHRLPQLLAIQRRLESFARQAGAP